MILWFAGVCFLGSLVISRLELFIRPNDRYSQLVSLYKFFEDNTSLAVSVKMFVSVTIFTLIFKAFLGLFKTRRFWNIIHRSDSLDGDYVYVFEDTGMGKMIFGRFEIVHTMEDLRLCSGRCWYGGTKNLNQNNQRGTFSNKRIGVGDYLWIPYLMTITGSTPDLKEFTYNGVMRLELQNDPAIKGLYLSGSLKNHDADVFHSGRIQAARLQKKDVEKLNSFNSIPDLIKTYLDIDVNEPIPLSQPAASPVESSAPSVNIHESTSAEIGAPRTSSAGTGGGIVEPA